MNGVFKFYRSVSFKENTKNGCWFRTDKALHLNRLFPNECFLNVLFTIVRIRSHLLWSFGKQPAGAFWETERPLVIRWTVSACSHSRFESHLTKGLLLGAVLCNGDCMVARLKCVNHSFTAQPDGMLGCRDQPLTTSHNPGLDIVSPFNRINGDLSCFVYVVNIYHLFHDAFRF